MWNAVTQHFHRQRALEEHAVTLDHAMKAMDESKRNFDQAVIERIEVDPFGEFAESARRSRF